MSTLYTHTGIVSSSIVNNNGTKHAHLRITGAGKSDKVGTLHLREGMAGKLPWIPVGLVKDEALN